MDCIINAAGLSSRMGRWKMMLPWREGTILDASIQNALQFCSRVILVTGFRAEELHSRYKENPRIKLVYNADYRCGLFTSVLCGSYAVESEYCFITHGDIPVLRAEIFQVIWSFRHYGVVIPYYRGTPGHPVLAASKQLQQILRKHNGTSIRKALLRDRHYSLMLNNPEIVIDIDTPDDFKKMRPKR